MRTLDPDISKRIKSEINSQDVVLFMKGTPVMPQCGFSAAVVGVLSHIGVQFRGVNVLEDEQIREGIKAYSDWPTIPQLYVKGEFMGGCDIVREMYETGELLEMLNTHGINVSQQRTKGSKEIHKPQSPDRETDNCGLPVFFKRLTLRLEQRMRSSCC